MSKDLPILKFHLKPRESRSFEHEGVHYKLGLDLFSEHDHKKNPLYYYPVPIEEADPNLWVVWIEDDTKDEFKYKSPTAGDIQANLFVCRTNVDVLCKKLKHVLRVWIYHEDKGLREEFSEKMQFQSKEKIRFTP